MADVKEQLSDLGHWLGADAYYYMNIRTFLEKIERGPLPVGSNAARLLEALTTVHKVMKEVKDGI